MSVLFTLLCLNNHQVPASLAAATQSELVKSMIEDCTDSETIQIPLFEINNLDLFTMMVSWCEYHVQDPAFVYTGDNTKGKKYVDIVSEYDRVFIDSMTKIQLVKMLKMASYMQIDTLVSLLSYTIGNIIGSKSMEATREWLEIDRDITNEEEYEIRQQHPNVFLSSEI